MTPLTPASSLDVLAPRIFRCASVPRSNKVALLKQSLFTRNFMPAAHTEALRRPANPTTRSFAAILKGTLWILILQPRKSRNWAHYDLFLFILFSLFAESHLFWIRKRLSVVSWPKPLLQNGPAMEMPLPFPCLLCNIAAARIPLIHRKRMIMAPREPW